MTPVIDYEEMPYGSSHFADLADIRSAGTAPARRRTNGLL